MARTTSGPREGREAEPDAFPLVRPRPRWDDGHPLGDGWPRRTWHELADECLRAGLARPVVRFLRFLGGLRACDQLCIARGEMRALSSEHLATVAGQVGGALLLLEREDAPAEVLDHVATLYEVLLEELDDRVERGEYLQPPALPARLRYGWRKPDGWREYRDWLDLVG